MPQQILHKTGFFFNGFEGGLKWVRGANSLNLNPNHFWVIHPLRNCWSIKFESWSTYSRFQSRLGESEKETSMGCLHMRPNQGLNLQPRLCALTGNQTRDASVHGMMFQPTATLARARGCFSNTSYQFVMHKLYFQIFPHQNSVS